ncbi:hypothetical protein SAMN05444166_6475 [Singulisphaera sp. GP187]|uniref:hypothetical protein n=1 Tax=Singulisphaera sp. GP187 TaxID=1882752 RepID=UPI0009297148|nr:hypothetical protein [Singulisphaera sp. GP187]SIO60655.1 hypothetical protein SAMN05444166_6475 [Singulisphaera sp. GP187]
MDIESNKELTRSDLEPAAFERPLPSGRTLVVRVGAAGEELEVRDRGGALELSISLTEAGPMVRIRAARIALESPETISLQCRRFEVDATEAVQLQSGGEVRIQANELRVRTVEDVHLDGAMIRLNCDPPPGPAPEANGPALEV